MAYASAEDRQHFREQGWQLEERTMQFVHVSPDGIDRRCVTAVWESRKPGDLDAPGPDEIYWAATAIRVIHDELSVDQVVTFVDRQQTPRAAFALAAIRAWSQADG